MRVTPIVFGAFAGIIATEISLALGIVIFFLALLDMKGVVFE